MSACNYCTLQGIKRRAKKAGDLVIVKSAAEDGLSLAKEVYVYPPGIKDNDRFKEEYKVAWFMELTDYCAC